MGAADLGEAVIAEEPVVGRPTNHQPQLATRQEVPAMLAKTRDRVMQLQRVLMTNFARSIIDGVRTGLIVRRRGNVP